MKSFRLLALPAWAAQVPLATAQTVQHGWKNRATIYLLGAGMDGTLTVRGVSAEVDASFSDVWSNLEFGAMANLRSESPSGEGTSLFADDTTISGPAAGLSWYF